MIAVNIVAILAPSSVPIYSFLVSYVYEAEVISAIGTARTAQRIYKAEHGNYPNSMIGLKSEKYISSFDFTDMKYVDYNQLYEQMVRNDRGI